MKFDWIKVIPELCELRTSNKSLKDIQVFLRENYGKDVTVARISQVLKQFKGETS